MNGSVKNLKREAIAIQNPQADEEITNNTTKDELLKKEIKEKTMIPDIAREQWFWDTAVPS